jgi:thiamine biosynthesis lipoprotein
MDRKRIFWSVGTLLFVVVLMVIFLVRLQAAPEQFDEHRIMMGTIVSISAWTDDPPAARAAVEQAFAEIARIESATTRYAPESGVSIINHRGPGEESLYIDLDVSQVVARSLYVSRASGGAFDVTIAPVMDLWSFEEGARPPDRADVEEALGRVGYERIRLHPSSGNLTLPLDAAIDLDGIAKGYAVDKAHRFLRTSGAFTGAILDAGGDLRFLGHPPGGGPWSVGIKHPRKDGLLGVVTTDGGSVATSGDYQHWFTFDGVRYHHILEPTTGYPARGVMSVTVLTERCMDADAFATAVFVLGPRRGMRLVESQEGMEAIIVTGEDEVDEVLLSSGLDGRYTPAASMAGSPAGG